MLIAGTSATVTPAAWFPEVVLQNGGTLIEVNVEATPFTAQCVASLRGAGRRATAGARRGRRSAAPVSAACLPPSGAPATKDVE